MRWTWSNRLCTNTYSLIKLLCYVAQVSNPAKFSLMRLAGPEFLAKLISAVYIKITKTVYKLISREGVCICLLRKLTWRNCWSYRSIGIRRVGQICSCGGQPTQNLSVWGRFGFYAHRWNERCQKAQDLTTCPTRQMNCDTVSKWLRMMTRNARDDLSTNVLRTSAQPQHLQARLAGKNLAAAQNEWLLHERQQIWNSF